MSTTDSHDRKNSHPGDRMSMPENHLDMVVTPGSIEPERRASMRTTIIAVVAMPLFFLLAFTICYVSASHAPTPHDMALTIAGPATTTAQIADSIEDEADGAFTVTETTSAAKARDAVENRDAVGAIVVDGADVTTVIASGGGRLASAVIQSAGSQVAAQLGGTSTVEDVAPLPSDDPGGSVLFFFLVICTVGAFLTITAISQVFPKARTRSLVASAVGAALFVPVIGFSMISLFVDFGATFGTTMAVIGVGMIYAFTVGILATLFTKLAGQGGIFLVILFLIALNFPGAGGSAPESMLPPFWQVIHNSWLGSGAFESMRSILFFGGEGMGRWITQLLVWTVVGIVLTALVAVVKKRGAARAEAEAPVAEQPVTGGGTTEAAVVPETALTHNGA